MQRGKAEILQSGLREMQDDIDEDEEEEAQVCALGFSASDFWP